MQDLLFSLHQLTNAAEHLVTQLSKSKRTDLALNELRWELIRAQLVLSGYRITVTGYDEPNIPKRRRKPKKFTTSALMQKDVAGFD